MKIDLRTDSVEKIALPALAVFGFSEEPAMSGTTASLPALTQKVLQELKQSGELTGKVFECVLIHRPVGLACDRLLVIGAGKEDKFSGLLHRRLAGTATRYLRNRGVQEFGWIMKTGDSDSDSPQWVVEGSFLGAFGGKSYRSESEGHQALNRLSLITDTTYRKEALQEQISRGQIVAEAQNWARELVNEPSNFLTPSVLANKAEDMASAYGLQVEVIGPKQIQSLKMGAFHSVTQGSEEPARLIVVRYAPPKAPASPVVGLIGKGVTFDSGGISIKPSEAMHEMKTDMAGAATMLAVMRIIAQLKPMVKVTALVPATENLPSGKAQKPGDVEVSLSGKTIEILNTDAEGRLLLADAITYAKQLGCTHLIDAATLTGAVVVALGSIHTGVFGWNQSWVDQVLRSASEAGEKFWQMPVDEDYRDQYKSAIADLANTGGRYGGAITGAMFIGEFAGETPWVHLDIAGTRWTNEEKPYMAKGATGVGVPALTHLIMHINP